MGIEEKKFEIIGEEMGPHSFTEEELLIVKRTIHTTADFEYKDLVEISKTAIETAKNIFSRGAKIYTDTNMALNGINKMALAKTNSNVICYVNEEFVHKEAKEKSITRSMAAVEKACNDNVDIFVFGNAPTALFRLKELIKEGKAKPQTCTTFAAVKTKGAHFVRLLMESSSFLNLACCAGGNCVMTFSVRSCISKKPDAANFMFSSICTLL